MRQRLFTSEQTISAFTSELAATKTTIEARNNALKEAEASLSAARANAQAATAAAEASAAHEKVLQSELADRRTLAEGTTRELREELAVLHSQVEGAAQSAAELKTEATTAATAAAAARSSEAAVAQELAQTAEEATRQHETDSETIATLRKAVVEAEERADAATVAAAERTVASAAAEMEQAVVTASTRARAEALAEVAAADVEARRAEGVERDELARVDDARMRSLSRELDVILLCVKASAATTAATVGRSFDERVLARRDTAMEDEDRREVERGWDVEGVDRMLVVAGQVSAHVRALRETIVLAEEKVSY